MKKIILFGWIAFVGLLVFQSCANNDEQLKKEIVGTWSYSTTDESEEDGVSTIISLNGTSVFNANGACSDNGIMTVIFIDDEGDKSMLKYRCEANGKFEIKKSHIIYDYSLENIAITLIQADDDDITDLFSELFNIQQAKHLMVENNREKILELNEKVLKTENEFEGEKETITHIRQSKQTTENQSQSTTNNLITRTSIAGIEIIGKTLKEVKPNINDALTWEYIEEEDSQPESYLIKNGEQNLLRFYIYNGRFSAMEIYDPSLSTADGLHVGSTAGDILK
ncbi:MAG: hypothetical protein LBR10_07225 [Prevotellaceae bacterium]|jgi:hypothetical protein|nr:hypothetical protein [Prevotellaceae bacterium]